MKLKNLTPKNFIVCDALRKNTGSKIKFENYLQEQRKAKSSNEKVLKHKAVKECIEVLRKKKALLESTISDLVKDTDKFSLEAEYAEKHRRDETVVINVKLLQENSNQKTELNERVWRRNKRIDKAERKYCLGLATLT